jgi:hypothetical protein
MTARAGRRRVYHDLAGKSGAQGDLLTIPLDDHRSARQPFDAANVNAGDNSEANKLHPPVPVGNFNDADPTSFAYGTESYGFLHHVFVFFQIDGLEMRTTLVMLSLEINPILWIKKRIVLSSGIGIVQVEIRQNPQQLLMEMP